MPQKTAPSTPTDTTLTSIAAAARELGVSEPMVRKLLRGGQLAGVHVGRRHLVRRDSLDALAGRQSRQPDGRLRLALSAIDLGRGILLAGPFEAAVSRALEALNSVRPELARLAGEQR